MRTFQPFAFQKVFRINLRERKVEEHHMAVSISTFVTIKIAPKISILVLVQKLYQLFAFFRGNILFVLPKLFRNFNFKIDY
jgi:hypothetical protein